jgi:hypothetical protein
MVGPRSILVRQNDCDAHIEPSVAKARQKIQFPFDMPSISLDQETPGHSKTRANRLTRVSSFWKDQDYQKKL